MVCWCVLQWCRLYEEGFVQATLLEPLHRYSVCVCVCGLLPVFGIPHWMCVHLCRQTAAMLECIAALSSSQTEPKLRSQPVTQPQPFKLTAPTVRLPPTPQLVGPPSPPLTIPALSTPVPTDPKRAATQACKGVASSETPILHSV